MAPIRVKFLPLAAIAYLACAILFGALAGAPLWRSGERTFLVVNVLLAIGIGIAAGYLRRPSPPDDGGDVRPPRLPPRLPRTARQRSRTPDRRRSRT